jgi:predicted PurR-regulated permease PerM
VPPEAPSPTTAPLVTAFLALGLAFFIVATLYLAADLLVPAVEALVVWFVLNAVANGIRRLPGIGPRIPRPVALLAAALIALAVGIFVVERAVGTVAALGPRLADFQQALDPLVAQIAVRLGVPHADVLNRFVDGLGIEAVLGRVVLAMFGLVNQFGLIAIYVAFLLVDQQFFAVKLRMLAPDPERRARIHALLSRIAGGIQDYLWVMTLMSALTSALSYAVLTLMQVEFAGFLATTIFFLNYIPTIGSILGTALPTLFALLQFQALGPTLVVLAGVGAVQFVVGNVLLPRVAGQALNISLFVTLFSLFAWGAIWGVTGMFVAMPLTAMLIITFGNFAATRPIAVILSRTGQVDPPQT